MSRKEFLERVEARLRNRKSQLKTAIESELRALRGANERLVGDVVDLAAEDEAHEVAGGLVEIEHEEFVLVNEAIERLHRGEYGVCEGCGNNIPVQRLQALPYTTTCVHCQRKSESTNPRSSVRPAAWNLNDTVSDDAMPPLEIRYERVA